MRLYGTIQDKTTGNPVSNATVQLFRSDGSYTGIGTAANSYGEYELFPPAFTSGNVVVFTSVGYQALTIELPDETNAQLDVDLVRDVKELEPVTVTSGGGGNNWWWLLLPAVAIAHEKKVIGKIEKSDVQTGLLIVGGIMAIGVVKKVLQVLHLGEGPGEGNVNNELENPNSPWKPAFWRSIPDGVEKMLIQESFVQDWIKKIYNAFTIFEDNFDQIAMVFSYLKTKSQVSYLSEKFGDRYNRDLLSFLKDGGGVMPWDGLSDTHLENLTNLVKNLPQYMPR